MKIERDDYSQQLIMEECYDSLYAELEREISILTADNDEGDLRASRTHSSSPWMAKRSSSIGYLAAKQQESYFCWRENDGSVDSVPSWILNLWRNSNGSGTGVFIPQIVNSRRRNKPRKKSNEKGRTYMPVANKKR